MKQENARDAYEGIAHLDKVPDGFHYDWDKVWDSLSEKLDEYEVSRRKKSKRFLKLAAILIGLMMASPFFLRNSDNRVARNAYTGMMIDPGTLKDARFNSFGDVSAVAGDAESKVAKVGRRNNSRRNMQNWLISMQNLGMLYEEQRESALAREQFEEAFRIYSKTFSNTRQNKFVVWSNMAPSGEPEGLAQTFYVWSQAEFESYLANRPTPTSGGTTLQGIVTLNNIRFHRAKTGYNRYEFANNGIIYYTAINPLNESAPYTVSRKLTGSNVSDNMVDGRNEYMPGDDDEIWEFEYNELTNSYERKKGADSSKAESFNKPFRPVFVLGGGIQFRHLDDFSFPAKPRSAKELESATAQRIEELKRLQDLCAQNLLRTISDVNGCAKMVEPRWRQIDQINSITNNITAAHGKLPKPLLDDTDGDGVIDQFDHEPNTPAGALVNLHGIAVDLNGDGIPDSRDKYFAVFILNLLRNW